MIFFLKLSLNFLYQALFWKLIKKMIGDHAHLRDVMSQSYPFMPVLLLIMRISYWYTL